MTSYEVVICTADGQRALNAVPADDEKEAYRLAAAMILVGQDGPLVIRGEYETREVRIEGTREPDPDAGTSDVETAPAAPGGSLVTGPGGRTIQRPLRRRPARNPATYATAGAAGKRMRDAALAEIGWPASGTEAETVPDSEPGRVRRVVEVDPRDGEEFVAWYSPAGWAAHEGQPPTGEEARAYRVAQTRAERIREGMGNVAALMAEAVKHEDHKALGYESWAAYIEGEFGAERLPARQALVALLRAEGMSTRAVADATGLSQSAVTRALPAVTESLTDSDAESNRSDDTHDSNTPSDQVQSGDGRRRPAQQSATQRQAARQQRQALKDARAGTADVIEPPEVTNADAHGGNVAELKRLARQLAGWLSGKDELPDAFYSPVPQFGEPSRLIKKRNAMGEVYESHWSKPKPPDATGDYLIAATLRVLAHGDGADTAADPREQAALALAQLNDAQSKIAELQAEVTRLTAERDELRARQGVHDPFATTSLESGQ